MNKVFAVLFAIFYFSLLFIVRPFECLLSAIAKSHLLSFNYFLDCYIDCWNDPKHPAIKDGVDMFKEYWNGVS